MVDRASLENPAPRRAGYSPQFNSPGGTAPSAQEGHKQNWNGPHLLHDENVKVLRGFAVWGQVVDVRTRCRHARLVVAAEGA